MSQISEVEDDVTEQMNEDAGDDSCTQLQSEIVDCEISVYSCRNNINTNHIYLKLT